MDGEQNGEQFEIDSGIDTGSVGDGGNAPGRPTPEPVPAQPSSSGRGTAVDLAAWARGSRQYPFDEVKLAIDDYVLGEIYKIVDARFVSVKSRRDAVQFLVAENIIDAADARDDV